MQKFLGLFCFSLFFQFVNAADLCLDGFCIGDDVETMTVSWKEIPVTYADERFIERELAERSIEDVYYDYNERLVADNTVLQNILTYVIRNQRFDQNVLNQLSRVRAICSSLTLTGEVEREDESRLFITFRAVPDNGSRGKLRVVRIEKEFNIMAPHLRFSDRPRFKAKEQELKQRFPQLQVVRDIDGRANTRAMQQANILLGFRFGSDVYNPLVLRLIDSANIAMIEESENAHPLCQSE